MATSGFSSQQWPSESFVESAGAVVFRLSDAKICLINHLKNGEFLLPKGRRNCSETRQQAALREVAEETGCTCRLLPVTMQTRAPPAIEQGDTPDEVRTFEGITEPFMLQMRETGLGVVKLIWWFIATVDEGVPPDEERQEDDRFDVVFLDVDDALRRLTYQGDRDMVSKAIDIVNATTRYD